MKKTEIIVHDLNKEALLKAMVIEENGRVFIQVQEYPMYFENSLEYVRGTLLSKFKPQPFQSEIEGIDEDTEKGRRQLAKHLEIENRRLRNMIKQNKAAIQICKKKNIILLDPKK